MMFQNILAELAIYTPFFIAGGFIIGGILLLKLGLVITKAESKTSFKWVVISFLIQYGITLFLSTPMLLDMILAVASGPVYNYQGPSGGIIAMVVIFSVFIIVNMINTMHKPGLKRSIVIALMLLAPIVSSNYLIFSNIGILFY